MKNVEYGDQIKQRPEYLTLAQQTTQRLDEIVGKSADQVSAKWDVVRDERNGEMLALRIWDSVGRGAARFTTFELKTPGLSRHRLYHIWGEVLEMQTDKMLKDLRAS